MRNLNLQLIQKRIGQIGNDAPHIHELVVYESWIDTVL